jgi:hypothetical protein
VGSKAGIQEEVAGKHAKIVKKKGTKMIRDEEMNNKTRKRKLNK